METAQFLFEDVLALVIDTRLFRPFGGPARQIADHLLPHNDNQNDFTQARQAVLAQIPLLGKIEPLKFAPDASDADKAQTIRSWLADQQSLLTDAGVLPQPPLRGTALPMITLKSPVGAA